MADEPDFGGSYATQTNPDFNGNDIAYPNYSWEIGLLEKNYCFEPVPHLWLEPTLSFIFYYSFSQSGLFSQLINNVNVPVYDQTNSKDSAYLFLGLDYEYFLPFLTAVSIGGGAGFGLAESWTYAGYSAPNPNVSENELNSIGPSPPNSTTLNPAAAFTAGGFNSTVNLDVNIYF